MFFGRKIDVIDDSSGSDKGEVFQVFYTLHQLLMLIALIKS